jgi:hypothetical protein
MPLIRKFARRFVMPASVIIRISHRHLRNNADTRGAFASHAKSVKGRILMRKIILAVLGSALIVATSVPFANAAPRHHGKANHAAVTQQQVQRGNADAYAAWPAPAVQPDWSRYSGGYSAPAGR